MINQPAAALQICHFQNCLDIQSCAVLMCFFFLFSDGQEVPFAFVFNVHLSHKILFDWSLTHTLFSTADRIQHPPSAPNEGGRFSLHAIIGPVEIFNGITQGNGFLNTICCPVLLPFPVSSFLPCFIVKFKVQWFLQVHCTQRPCNYSLSCLFLCRDAVSNSDNLYYRIHSMHGWSVSRVCTNKAGAKKREDVKESALSTEAPFEMILFTVVKFIFLTLLFLQQFFFLLYTLFYHYKQSPFVYIGWGWILRVRLMDLSQSKNTILNLMHMRHFSCQAYEIHQ